MAQFNMTQFTPEDVEIASALTDDELRARIAMYQNILSQSPLTGQFNFYSHILRYCTQVVVLSLNPI